MNRSPALAETLRNYVEAGLADVRVSMPGRVERYDAATQQVDVQPLIKEPHEDESGELVMEALPVIPHVPVAFPGGGGYRVTFPLQRGDTGLLLWASSSLDKWLAQGGLVDPEDQRRHNATDAVFLPGLRDFAHPLLDAPVSGASFGMDGGPQVLAEAAALKLGRLAVEPVIRGQTYRAAEDLLFTAFAAAFAALASDPALTSGKASCAAVAAAMTTFQTAATVPGGFLSLLTRTE